MRYIAGLIFAGLLLVSAGALALPQVAQLEAQSTTTPRVLYVPPSTDWAPIIVAIGGLIVSLGTAIASIIAASRAGRAVAAVGNLTTTVEAVKTSALVADSKRDVIADAVKAVQGKLDRVELNTNSITQRLEAASRSEGVAVGTAIGRKEVTEEHKAADEGKPKT